MEGLLQVFGIFTSADTEAGLRKSALEQIAIILQGIEQSKWILTLMATHALMFD